VLDQRRFSTSNCEQVEIKKDENWGYEEFPHDEDLRYFDPSDRKFVAVAIQSINSPVILNATDNDWREHGEALNKYVNIEELCPNCLRE
jgi:preprotein translocase subunit SecA